MLILISRLFGMFALKSKKILFPAGGILLLLLFLSPVWIRPAADRLSIRSRLNLISRINSVERAKLREAALKKGYDRILADYSKLGGGITLAAPKGKFKATELFKKPNPGKLLTGSILWVLLGLTGLFARDVKPLHRILVLLLFSALGLASGLLLIGLPILAPSGAYLGAVLLSETALFCVFGTLIQEVNRK